MIRLDGIEGGEDEVLEEGVGIETVVGRHGGEGGGAEGGGGRGGGFREAVEAKGEGGGPERTGERFGEMGFGRKGEPDGGGAKGKRASNRDTSRQEHVDRYKCSEARGRPETSSGWRVPAHCPPLLSFVDPMGLGRGQSLIWIWGEPVIVDVGL